MMKNKFFFFQNKSRFSNDEKQIFLAYQITELNARINVRSNIFEVEELVRYGLKS